MIKPDNQSFAQSVRDIWSFFDTYDRARFLFLYLLMLINGFLEVAGLIAIFPIIGILTSENWRQQYSILGDIQDWTGVYDRGDFAVLLMLGLFIYFLFRNAFRIWITWRSFRLICTIHCRLVNELVKSVLGQNYAWFSQRNASQHLQLINDDANKIVGFLRGSAVFLAEATSTFCIILVLVYSEPAIFVLMLAFLAVPAYLFQRSVRSYLRRISSRMRELGVAAMTSLREVFGAIKEVKVTGSEGYTTRTHSRLNDERNRLDANYGVVQELPKIILENAFLGGMVFVIAIYVVLNDSVSGSLAYLGVLAIAGFRAVPVINKGLTIINSAGFCAASVSEIRDQLNNRAPVEKTASSALFAPLTRFALQSVSFRYVADQPVVLDGIDMQVDGGEMIGIVGASGSGKTTIVDILLGLLVPQSGQVIANGVHIHNDLHQWRQQIAYVPQSIFLVDRDIRHNVAFAIAGEAIDDERVNEALAAAQLTEVVASMPDGIRTLIGEGGVRLSGGQRQRIGIARALYRQPQLLVLDEATSALDKATEARFMTTVETMHHQCTMIIIAHRMTTIAHCDRVFQLQNGGLQQVNIADIT